MQAEELAKTQEELTAVKATLASERQAAKCRISELETQMTSAATEAEQRRSDLSDEVQALQASVRLPSCMPTAAAPIMHADSCSSRDVSDGHHPHSSECSPAADPLTTRWRCVGRNHGLMVQWFNGSDRATAVHSTCECCISRLLIPWMPPSRPHMHVYSPWTPPRTMHDAAPVNTGWATRQGCSSHLGCLVVLGRTV